MATATKTYLSIISQDEKAAKKEGLKITAQEASIGVQTEVMKLNSAIAKLKTQLVKVSRQVPYNVNSVFEVHTSIENLEEKLKFVKNINDTLFTDVTI